MEIDQRVGLRRTKRRSAAGAFAAVALLASAAGARPVTAEDVTQFKVGESTSAEVIAKLGPPLSIATSSTGVKVLIYGSTHGHVKALTFVPIVGLFAGGATAQSTAVVFTFDSDDKLKSTATNTSNSDCSVRLGAADCGH